MLLSIHQADPDPSSNSKKHPGDVSEDELDLILATLGKTSLKDSEMAQLQDDVDHDELAEEEKEPVQDKEPVSEKESVSDKQPVMEKPQPESTARRVVKKLFNRFRNAR